MRTRYIDYGTDGNADKENYCTNWFQINHTMPEADDAE